MKSYHILFAALALVGLILFYVSWNVGLFKPVVIEQVTVPKATLVFQKHIGPYHEVGKVFEAVEKQMAEAQKPCFRTFGRYYDNPDQVEAERLRADIGCWFEEPVTSPPSGLFVEESASFEALRGTFDGAPWMTAFKVYSTLKRESFQRNLYVETSPALELYEKTQTGFRTQVHFRIPNKP